MVNTTPHLHVREVRACDIPKIETLRPRSRRYHRWMHLVREMLLRLEQTGADKALAVQFETVDDAQLAYYSLRQRFTDLKGHDAIRMSLRGDVIYVRRGVNWTKNGAVWIGDDDDDD